MRARNWRTVPERDAFFEKIGAERDAGRTLAAIGRKWGLSATRVSQCLRYWRIRTGRLA